MNALEDDPAPCVVCGKPPCLGINGMSYCEDHIADGMQSLGRTMRHIEKLAAESLEASTEEKGG